MAQYTAEEVRSWTKMEEAFNRAASRFGSNSAMEALWERIRSGLIPTASLRWMHQLGERGVPHPETNPRILTTGDWTAYRGVLPRNLWRGEAQFIYPSKDHSPDRHMKCFEIVCDPATLDVEFPRPASTEASSPAPEVKHRPLSESDQAQPTAAKGAPVSEAHLAEWAALFRKAYPTGSEQLAATSAAGMFPGKSVPREMLRTAIRKVGALKRGQKSGKDGD